MSKKRIWKNRWWRLRNFRFVIALLISFVGVPILITLNIFFASAFDHPEAWVSVWAALITILIGSYYEVIRFSYRAKLEANFAILDFKNNNEIFWEQFISNASMNNGVILDFNLKENDNKKREPFICYFDQEEDIDVFNKDITLIQNELKDETNPKLITISNSSKIFTITIILESSKNIFSLNLNEQITILSKKTCKLRIVMNRKGAIMERIKYE